MCSTTHTCDGGHHGSLLRIVTSPCFFICLDIEACSESKKLARHLADQLGAMAASMSSVIRARCSRLTTSDL